MSRSARMLTRWLFAVAGIAALAGAISLGVVVAQQPSPATKATQIMKQAIAEFPGHEVTMITLDIPPGGGSVPHRHPTTHNFGYVLEGAYRIKLDDGPERVLTKGDTFYEAPPTSFTPCRATPAIPSPRKFWWWGSARSASPRPFRSGNSTTIS